MDILNIVEKKEEKTLSKEEQNDLVAAVLTKMQVENKSLKEALGVSSSLLEQIYSLASGHYQKGNYKEALSLFNMLATTDPTNFNYLFAFASTCHQMKYYHDAIMAFATALDLNKESAEAAYYLADSFYHVNMLEASEKAFTVTIELCGDKKEHRILKEQSILLRNTLRKN